MRRGRSVLAMVFTMVLVLSTVFCIGSTVMSRNIADATFEEMENYYRPMENEVVEATREYLNGAGYRNCGITMNHTVDAEGGRSYTLMMHHSKFDELDESEKLGLVSALNKLTFEGEMSHFEHVFF